MRIKNSESCGKYELDLFNVPPTQVAIDEGYWDDIKPHPNFQKGTVTFDIPGDSNNYLSLSDSELWVTVSLRNTNNSNEFDSEKLEKLGPVNNLFHCLYSQVQVSLNNSEVENSNSVYPYRAYIENLLCYGREAKETFLQQEMFIKDKPGTMGPVFSKVGQPNATPPVAAVVGNDGFEKRIEKFVKLIDGTKRAKTIQLRGRIHSDLFNMNKYMLSNVGVQVKLTRQRPEFYLMGDPEQVSKSTIQIEDCFMRVRRVKVSPSIMYHHAMELERTTAKYPIKRVMVKYFALPFRASKTSISQVHSGILPSRVIVGFVPTAAFDGSADLNPYDFRHMNLTSLKLKVTSKNLPYSSGLDLDFKNDMYMQGYNSLYQNIRESANDISYDDYKDGYTLFAFNLSPDLCADGEQFSELKDGSLDLDVDFEKLPEDSITAVFYLEFDNVIEITKQRNVLFDYQV